MTGRPSETGDRRRPGDVPEAGAVFLIDGTQLVYRAHFAFIGNPMRTSDGRDVSALFGFSNTIFHIIRELGAEHVAVFFDAPGKTFRHEAYSEYKATRPPTPTEIKDQIPEVKRFLDEAGIFRIEQEGIEADDMIGATARHLAASGREVVLVGSDKDLMQLVGEHVRQYSPARGPVPARWYGPGEVEEKWGVPPGRLRDLLALVGDTSDNVPGVPGIGPKTAAQLLHQFDSLEAIYERLDEIRSKATRRKLEENRDKAFLSRDLVTLRDDAPPIEDVEALAVPDPTTREGLREFLREFEFRRLDASLGAAGPETAPEPVSVRRINSPAALEKACAELAAAGGAIGVICLGPVRTARSAELTGVALSAGDDDPVFIDAGDLDAAALRRHLGPILADPARPKVGHDLKPAIHRLRSAGLDLAAPLDDVKITSYVLDPSRRHDFTALAQEFLGETLVEPSEEKGGDLFSEVAISDEAASAAGRRAEAARRLADVMNRSCEARGQSPLLRETESPLISVLADMEWHGVAVDAGVLEKMRLDLQTDLRRLEEKAFGEAGGEFNLNSPTQLREILFDRLKLPPRKKTKTGYSTDSAVLESLAELHPLPQTLLEYRLLEKLRSTYLDVLPKLLDSGTKRLHATFHQTVAATGRLSSSDPNLQNIPIRSPVGRGIRKAFIASPEEWRLLSADYSQIELRLLAHISGDDYLTEAFRRGDDIHTATACRVFDVEPGAVDGGLRAKAKIANFGIIYGMGPQRLAAEMSITVPEAKKFISEYLDRLPGVRSYIDEGLEAARDKGYVETIAGRRRYLPDLKSRDHRWRSQAERMAINTPIQGSAADLIKIAMVKVHGRLKQDRLRSRLVLQIHDELLLEVHPEEMDLVATMVRSEMEGAAALDVPLLVEVGSGRTWWDAHG